MVVGPRRPLWLLSNEPSQRGAWGLERVAHGWEREDRWDGGHARALPTLQHCLRTGRLARICYPNERKY